MKTTINLFENNEDDTNIMINNFILYRIEKYLPLFKFLLNLKLEQIIVSKIKEINRLKYKLLNITVLI
jgi:hypothetical protein